MCSGERRRGRERLEEEEERRRRKKNGRIERGTQQATDPLRTKHVMEDVIQELKVNHGKILKFILLLLHTRCSLLCVLVVRKRRGLLKMYSI